MQYSTCDKSTTESVCGLIRDHRNRGSLSSVTGAHTDSPNNKTLVLSLRTNNTNVCSLFKSNSTTLHGHLQWQQGFSSTLRIQHTAHGSTAEAEEGCICRNWLWQGSCREASPTPEKLEGAKTSHSPWEAWKEWAQSYCCHAGEMCVSIFDWNSSSRRHKGTDSQKCGSIKVWPHLLGKWVMKMRSA